MRAVADFAPRHLELTVGPRDGDIVGANVGLSDGESVGDRVGRIVGVS